MISTHSRSSHLRSARQGFSLIEVAIALVIFVIGALAIIRIFPGALSVIGNNGDQQIATNLNRSVAARLQSENAVPYANFNIAVNADGSLQWTTADNTNHTADFGAIPASVIGVPRFNNSLPAPEDINTQANNSALSRFRGIQGEQVQDFKINDGGPPLIPDVPYALTQFPISFAKIGTGTTDEILLPTLSQEYTVRNARIDKNGNVTLKDATITDVKGDEIRLDAATDTEDIKKNKVPAKSMIYVSYRYYNTSGQIWGVTDEARPVSTAIDSPNTPDKLTDASFTVNPPLVTRAARSIYNASAPAPNTTGAVAEVIDIRVKRYLGVGQFGGPNSPAFNAPGYPDIDQVGDARRGMIRLDGVAPQRINNVPILADYVADWSLLLQQSVPLIASDAAPGARQVALGAPFIEDQSPVGIYSVLIDIDKNPTQSPPPYQPFRSQFGTDYPAPALGNRLIAPTEDELRAGKATFDVTTEVSKARVAYRTRDNWVQQLSVAAKAYKPYVGSAAFVPAEPWRDYYLGDDNYLYFHAGEAGKTISVSYRTTNDKGPLVDRPFVIETQLVKVPTAFYNGLGARVELSAANGVAFKDDTTNDVLVSIQGIKGTSVTVRTAYINGSKYAQTLLTSNRGANS